MKSSSDFLQLGSSKSTPCVLLKQMASNCLILSGRNISMSSLKTASKAPVCLPISSMA